MSVLRVRLSMEGLLAALRERGYVEGHNLMLEK
jgi:hypothetical protein